MSEHATSALPGASFRGAVDIHEAGLTGMVTLRADLGAASVATAVQQATGCALPARRRLVRQGDMAVAWMSPDELLILCPHARAAALETDLTKALEGEFATAANLSDARAAFCISGAEWRGVLAKLCPVDFAALSVGELRRTRAAQVAMAVMVDAPDQVTVICFRSVAGYVFDLLSNAAASAAVRVSEPLSQ